MESSNPHARFLSMRPTNESCGRDLEENPSSSWKSQEEGMSEK